MIGTGRLLWPMGSYLIPCNHLYASRHSDRSWWRISLDVLNGLAPTETTTSTPTIHPLHTPAYIKAAAAPDHSRIRKWLMARFGQHIVLLYKGGLGQLVLDP